MGFEIRGKKLGIVGYGSIGTQLSVMAESMGMEVMFYDVVTKLPLGNAHQGGSLKELLNKADVVTLHVPETAATKWMMGAEQFAQMKEGSIMLNASRGTVVDIDALADAIRKKNCWVPPLTYSRPNHAPTMMNLFHHCAS